MDNDPPPPDLDRHILRIRGQSVMLDFDLARIYGVSTKRLNEQVRRNRERFPEDFTFRLAPIEAQVLMASRTQNATLKRGQNIKHLPYAFTEHGAMMAAYVLKSPVAVAASIQIVRAFNRMRRMMAAHKGLAAKLAELERKFDSHDVQIQTLFETIRGFLEPPPEPPRRIGFSPG